MRDENVDLAVEESLLPDVDRAGEGGESTTMWPIPPSGHFFKPQPRFLRHLKSAAPREPGIRFKANGRGNGLLKTEQNNKTPHTNFPTADILNLHASTPKALSSVIIQMRLKRSDYDSSYSSGRCRTSPTYMRVPSKE